MIGPVGIRLAIPALGAVLALVFTASVAVASGENWSLPRAQRCLSSGVVCRSSLRRLRPPGTTATSTTTKPVATTTTTKPVATTTTSTTTPTTTPQPPPPGGLPVIAGCQVFPADNAWNRDISGYPLHPNSATFIASIGTTRYLHPDFGGGGMYGIPFNVVDGSQPFVPINFTAYGDESDPGPYPVPYGATVEGGSDTSGDRHVLVLDKANCTDYELYRGFVQGTPGSYFWNADSGAVWNLASNALRPIGWTSADAAGLPILPGLVRYDEVAAGAVDHAIRCTVSSTQKGFILPATQYASSSTNAALPPMGLRVRLKADFDTSPFAGESLVILKAMKKYGMVVADNGSNWYFQGDGDPRWNDDDLNQLKTVPGSSFEVVDTGPIRTS